MTLPREASVLAGQQTHLRALPHWMPGRADRSRRSPVVLLMSEADLRRRERRIIESPDLSPEDKQVLVQNLNAGAAMLAIDDQRRVVLPAHLVDYLRLARDALFVTTGDLIYLWNPDEFRTWSETTAPSDSPDLSQFILV